MTIEETQAKMICEAPRKLVAKVRETDLGDPAAMKIIAEAMDAMTRVIEGLFL